MTFSSVDFLNRELLIPPGHYGGALYSLRDIPSSELWKVDVWFARRLRALLSRPPIWLDFPAPPALWKRDACRLQSRSERTPPRRLRAKRGNNVYACGLLAFGSFLEGVDCKYVLHRFCVSRIRFPAPTVYSLRFRRRLRISFVAPFGSAGVERRAPGQYISPFGRPSRSF